MSQVLENPPSSALGSSPAVRSPVADSDPVLLKTAAARTVPPPPATDAPAPSKPARSKPHRSKQGFFCLWHGLNRTGVRRLKRHGFRSTPGYRLRWATIELAAWSNSWHEWLEDRLFGRQVAAVSIDQPPLFVLGHWRSGTTLLHNLLSLDSQFVTPNLYQVLFPGHFLLTERLVTALTGWLIPKTRPMDNIPAGWKMAQEDEFALLLRTLVSPFMLVAHQGDRARYKDLFDLEHISPADRQLWIDEFLKLLKKLTLRAPKPILLKSPSHTYRIPLLLDLFPNARFVYIYRNPYAVYNSTVHLRRTMFVENALRAPNFEGLEEDTLVTYEAAIRRYEATKTLIPAGQLHELRFEDLELDPVGEMQQVYRALDLPGWSAVEPRIREQLPEHNAYQKNRFSLDHATKTRLYDRLRFVFDRYGYPSQLDDA